LKRINVMKVVLDLAITVAFLLLMEPKSTGMSLHEWGGLGICAFFAVHKLLNWSWIKAITKAFFTRKATVAARLGYVVDLLLLAGFSLIALSGMGMAKTIDFSWLLPSSMTWKALHSAASFLALAAVGIHVGLHARWIGSRVREIVASAGAGRAAAKAAVAAAIIEGGSDAR
jgi:hypothetical protein